MLKGMMQKPKVLVIEDDADFREVMTALLEPFYTVECVESGVVGLKSVFKHPPSLIILDLKMPDMDGFQTCKVLRSDHDFDNIPIVVISGYGGTADRTRAFEAGADDFITKPFDSEELLQRLQRKIKTRSLNEGGNVSKPSTVSCGNLHLNLAKREAELDGRVLSLSDLEFRLIYFLAAHSEKLVSRDSILENIWQDTVVSPRIMDPHIVSLREKLSGSSVSINAVYGKGYILKRNS